MMAVLLVCLLTRVWSLLVCQMYGNGFELFWNDGDDAVIVHVFEDGVFVFLSLE